MNGLSAATIAQRFGGLSPSAVWRHGKAHLTPAMRAALLAQTKPSEIDLDALRTRESEGLLAGLVAQRARLLAKADQAMEWHDVKASVAAENAISQNYALVGRLLGQLVQHHAVSHTNLLISPDYIRLRSTLIAALRPFPEAARAVGAALHRLESDAATDITAAAKRPARPEPVLIEHEPAAPAPITILPPPPC